jgi:hypothetical protein
MKLPHFPQGTGHAPSVAETISTGLSGIGRKEIRSMVLT